MRHIGNVSLVGGGVIENLRVEVLAENPANPLVGQIWYNSTLGQYMTYDGTTVSSIALSQDIVELETLVQNVRGGAGLNATGEYEATPASNYLQAATSLNSADQLLDAKIKELADVVDAGGSAELVKQELDATQIGAGLNTDGSYAAFTDSNYIDGATSLHNADKLLDGQISVVSGIAGNALTAAQGAGSAAEAAALAASEARTVADNALSSDGGTMAGNIAMGGVHKITGLADGTSATDAVNKGQLDAALAGLDFQPDVFGVQIDATLVPEAVLGRRYVITNAAALADEFGTIDGLVNNDIVEYDGTEFQVVYSVAVSGPGAITWNRSDSVFWYFGASAWSAFGGMSGVEAGVGLAKTGNVLSVELGAGIGQLPSNEVGLDLRDASGLFLTEDGIAASTGSNAQLAIRLAGGSLELDVNGLQIADAGVTAAHIAASAIGNGLDGGNGDALTVVAKLGGGIVVDADGLSINPTVLEFLPLAGGELEGPLLLAADPTEALGAATKQMVDALDSAITDVAQSIEGVETQISEGHFVYDGTGASSVTHTVNHNIGRRFVNVIVTDATGEVVIPDSIVLVDNNSLTVSFQSAVTCFVSVMGAKTVQQ